MRHCLPIITALLLLFIAPTEADVKAGGGAFKRTGEVIQNEVCEIYVPAGPIQETLPELIVQLQVPAGLIVGDLKSIDTRNPPSHRVTKSFEFPAGTVAQALTAFVAMHPFLSWTHKDGVVHLRRRINDEQGTVTSLLRTQLGRFTVTNQSYDSVMNQLGDVLRQRHPALLEDQTFHPSTEDAYVNPILKLRVPFDDAYSFALDHADVEAVLDQLVTANGNALWFAYDDVDSGGFRPGFQGLDIGMTAWSPDRREMVLQDLILAINPEHEDAMGYRTVDMRIEAARRELTRRHHYHSAGVVQALLNADLPRVLAAETNVDLAISLLRWMIRLDEPDLTQAAITAVRKLEPGERRIDVMMWAFPREHGLVQNLNVTKLWQDLATNDPDSAVRRIARETLGWLTDAPSGEEDESGTE